MSKKRVIGQKDCAGDSSARVSNVRGRAPTRSEMQLGRARAYRAGVNEELSCAEAAIVKLKKGEWQARGRGQSGEAEEMRAVKQD
ncbi:hypothetical protein NDU88_011832 [Pleurodeles waltl]|uniref:Uncharacterized protein n=1 Tax=Pleurodeles waltl TaxID=8319 RepID=A0AAV7QYV9_PLEWA|nr:hypothetical protein NDU88_011832 [Pleurodeles waltl]